ncbi:hypothetical protein, partial, partial [Absidia glauca]
DAGWTDNYQTAQVCINALPQRLKEFVVNKFFDTKNHKDENASYHKVPTKASQVLNIAMKYNGYSNNSNNSSSMGFSNHMKRVHETTYAPSKRTKQHCEIHPHQASHSTANCWSRPENEHLTPSRWRGPKHTPDNDIRVQAISRTSPDEDMEYTDLRQISEGMLDTGADVSVISYRLVELYRIPFKSTKGTLLLAGANNKINRIGTTHPLLIHYNYKTIYHTFEIMQLPDQIDLYLGMNLIPTLGIYIGGLAVQWSDQVTSVKEKDVDDHPPEPNDSPAVTKEEQKTFHTTLQPYVKANQSIPTTSFCPLDIYIVTLPTTNTPSDKVNYRQYPIPHKIFPVVDQAVQTGLADGTIVRAPVNTSWNSPITLAPKKDEFGQATGKR